MSASFRPKWLDSPLTKLPVGAPSASGTRRTTARGPSVPAPGFFLLAILECATRSIAAAGATTHGTYDARRQQEFPMTEQTCIRIKPLEWTRVGPHLSTGRGLGLVYSVMGSELQWTATMRGEELYRGPEHVEAVAACDAHWERQVTSLVEV